MERNQSSVCCFVVGSGCFTGPESQVPPEATGHLQHGGQVGGGDGLSQRWPRVWGPFLATDET